MGMQIGLIAVRGTVSEVVGAFGECWPELEVVGTQVGFGSEDEVWEWKDANERFVSAADWTKDEPGQEVYVICQDGEWAVIMDFSYVLPMDGNGLVRLSERFGSVLSFVVQSTSGCAYFWNYESGELRRAIENVDGEMDFEGEPLPEEAGIAVEQYYMDETEQLMQAFGLSPFDQLLVPGSATAIATIDRTDYSGLHDNTPAEDTAKPWWKFW